MKYLFFDTETTGFPPKAHLVSIAWQIWNDEVFVEKDYYIIKPENFYIPYATTLVHGISTDYALENGVNLEVVMNKFAKKIKEVDAVVAHNYNFDARIVESEFNRLKKSNPLTKKIVFDTMKSSKDYLKLPSKRGFKPPKLQELYSHLFGRNFDDAHSADADVEATVKCFFEMKKLNII